MTTQKRAAFGSRIGMVLAAAGSAVGLGNIWRFPYEAGNNGGGAFLLIYLGCVVLIGLPLMVSEFLVGRRSQANTALAFETLVPRSAWKWVGRGGVLTAFLILSYYCVVAGWTLEYMLESATNSFAGKTAAEYASNFGAFITNPWRPLIWLFVFMGITHYVVVRGVEAGIERASKIMMPLLFILLIILLLSAVTLPNAGKGVEFLLTPDFSKVTGSTFLSAMGQAFFSLSLGMGLTTYASYFDRKVNITKTALSVCSIDTLVAMLAGFIIFPAAFSVGIQPDAGPGLVFITLPNVFQQAFGSMPFLAMLLSLMFYALLALAALTSAIFLHEVATAYLHEEFAFSRTKSASIITASALVLGVTCSLSLGPLKDYTLFGMVVFDCFDYFTAKIMLPLVGFFIAIFVGWRLDKRLVKEEVTHYGELRDGVYKLLIFFVRYLVPAAILSIFLNELKVFS
ncbi:Uncharacterized sodium-dependent transporter YhdH [uncultured delta proteobacterium]|uniref:Transporter n=1 Tax=uncultured delta proteobacterium TaxID=34034 RepID=A0A212JYQ0_9DELT|nr:Uncharacterized sodium-dependent transporter YhdH [uncultured delta proteobacterium]